MNKTLQHILHNLELQPPAGVWDQISRELGETQSLRSWKHALQDLEAAPPPSIWPDIHMALSEADMAVKLNQAEQEAPAAVWPRILSGLEQPSPAKKTSLPFLRYAAAAMVAGALIWAGLQWLPSGNQQEKTLAGSGGTVTPAQNEPELNEEQARENLAAILASTDPVQDGLEEARNDAALEASKRSFAHVEPGMIKRKLREVAGYNFDPEEEDAAPVYPSAPKEAYILFLTPDGHIIRMSPKLKDFICCLSGEEIDPACQEQLKRWQEKMIQVRGDHAPGSFGDLLDLLKSLNENR